MILKVPELERILRMLPGSNVLRVNNKASDIDYNLRDIRADSGHLIKVVKYGPASWPEDATQHLKKLKL